MSIGKKLREARERRGLSLQDAFKAIRIRWVYLQALEDEDWEAFPSRTHLHGFLRAYAEYLGLDADALLAELTGEPVPAEPPSAVETPSVPAAAEETLPAQETPAPPDESDAPDDFADIPPDDWPVSRRIFAEIGETLRARRELLGLSLDEIAYHTHLARPYLEALEQGAFERLPTPVQMRGMLQQYAAFIELDVDAVLLRFAEGLQAWRAERFAADEGRRVLRGWHLPRFLRRVLGPDILLLVILVGVLTLALGGWVYLLNAAERPAATPLPSISDVLLAEPTMTTVALLPAENTAAAQAPAVEEHAPMPTLSAVMPDAKIGAVQVAIAVSRRVWLRVLVDGEEVLRDRAVPGAAYSFGGRTRIEVQASDASALQIYFNGRDLGILGPPESVLTLVFGLDAVMTPTVTVTPTPTITPTPTVTPTPTRTPVPTRTPRP